MKRPLILNVDDNAINRYLRSKFLQEANLDVLEASSGAETLQIAFQQQPDLVLLDVNLPDAHATELCRVLKTDPRTKGTMVLQISASAMAITDAVRGLEGGADGYLIEPVEPELLMAHVRSLLRLRESQLELRRLNERLQEFAFLASHDLQQPLRTVMIYAEMLGQELSSYPNESAKHHLGVIASSASRLETLLSDLLTYARASDPRGAVAEPVSLEACLESAIGMCQTAIAESEARITHDPLPFVEGDQTGLTQVLQNLISNAIKYRKPDCPANIHITATQGSRETVVSVRDDGQGFAQEYAEHIFGLFKRLHGVEVPGSGIGLSVCRAIIERLGGRLWAEGRKDAGATFYFALPAFPTGKNEHNARLNGG